MNIVVHVQESITRMGYEWGTRQAWKCGVKAHEVTRVIGVVNGTIVSVIDGVHAELSNTLNNPEHTESAEGRYVFLGGRCWNEKQLFANDIPKIMFKKIKGLNQGHRYLTDEELEHRLC